MALISHFSNDISGVSAAANLRIWTASTIGGSPPGRLWTKVGSGAGAYAETVLDPVTDKLWPDDNHIYPGCGRVGIILPLYFGTEVPTLNNLLNCRAVWDVEVQNLKVTPDTKLVMWVQGTDAATGMPVNYFNRVQTFSEQLGFGNRGYDTRAQVEGIYDSGIRTCTFDFNPDYWRCMGSSRARDGVGEALINGISYTCVPDFGAWLANTASTKLDYGMLAISKKRQPVAWDGVSGTFRLHKHELFKPA